MHGSAREAGAVGKLLLRHVEVQALPLQPEPELLEAYLEKVYLGVFETNAGARRFYETMGFCEEGRNKDYFRFGQGRYVDDIRMSLYVKPGLAPEGFNTWQPQGGGDHDAPG